MKLPESVSSWTLDIDIAKRLKGGVPESGEIGVIVALLPQYGSVVVNLNELYSNLEFVNACAYHAHEIKKFDRGIGKWWDSQREVVLEIDEIQLGWVCAIGGWSSAFQPADAIAARIGVFAIEEMETLRLILSSANADGRVPRWITKRETLGRLLEFWAKEASKRVAIRRADGLA